MTIILAGGGDPPQSISTDRHYAALIRASPARQGSDLQFIPNAVIPDWSTDQAVDWLQRDSFADLSIKVVDDLAHIAELPEPRSIFLMGGNTFRLLNDILKNSAEPFLRHYAEEGILYGCSAGAIVLGQSIRSAYLGQEADTNDVGLSQFDGLDLLGGLNVLPHFVPADLDSIKGLVEEEGSGCLCIAEDGGALWDGRTITNVGASELLLVRPGIEAVNVALNGAFTPIGA